MLLVAILAILGGVGATYRIQKRALQENAPAQPEALPLDLSAVAQDWQWSHTSGGKPVVEVRAKNLKQTKDTGQRALENVELRLYHNPRNNFDLVRSAQAEFREAEGILFSPGEVEITLGIPVEGPAPGRLVSIRSSGVTFESKTGKASTDKPAHFIFEHGEGDSVGASYDPHTKELHLRGGVHIDWRGAGPNGRVTKMESGELTYQELNSKIWLRPWARLTRENSTLEGAETVVTMKEGVVQFVEAQDAHGADRDPQRQVQYAAGKLWVTYSEQGQVEKVSGEPNAKLVSTTQTSETTVTSNRVDLEFQDFEGESALRRALAQGNAAVESKPLPVAGAPIAQTRVLSSETIEMKMREGGREIDAVETHAPGVLNFLPNAPGQRKRHLEGERIWIAYGADNQIQSFRSVDVSTRSEPVSENKPVLLTWSKHLTADFDPSTGDMKRMEQTENFRYEEGARKGSAKRAILESQISQITLESGARVWDPTGATSADVIRLDQDSGNFTAEGHVNSSRLPDKKDPSSGMLSGDEPVQAVAERMTSAQKNSLIQYRGKSVLWQGANRIQANDIEIDRDHKRLTATGSVITQLREESGKAAGFTIVKAPRLVYTDPDRLAHYTGGVFLSQPGTQVKGTELRAYLAESGAESRLEKAFADGKVEIVQTAIDRTRTGTGEHAEYYVGEGKIVLRGGEPQFSDTLRGNTRGAELTYYSNDDRLLVNGSPERPATSRLRRR